MRAKEAPGRDLIKGAIAGAVATWAMGQVTTLLYEHEDPDARRREDEVRGGKTSYEVAAERAARLAGLSLAEQKRKAAGAALHWALGIGAGAAYGALRHRIPGADRAHGLAFGLAFWAAVDEALVPALGLTPGPTAFPWQAHARGLAGHLAYGLVAETTLDLLDRVA